MNSFSSLVRAGLFFVAAAAIPLSTGCGMDVGVSGSTGTGGHASGAGGSCSNGVTSVGVGGNQQSGAGGAEMSTSVSTGVGGGGAFCGGIAGVQCAADEFCDFPSNSCGFADESGTCQKRPMACDASYSPTCGCDGKIYGNPCTANGAGHDVAPAGTCPAPMEMFACGAQFCGAKTQYCERQLSDIANEPDTYTCKDLPAACLGDLSCACIAGVPCGNACAAASDGTLQVNCPGG
jgi:hypothetical protein